MGWRKNRLAAAAATSCVLLASAGASAVTLSDGTDTDVRESRADRAYGSNDVVEWDGRDRRGENHALLHFPIFQDEGGPVDPAVVTGGTFRAYLVLDVVNRGDGGDIHRLTSPFDDSSTWNSLGGGVDPGRNALATPDAQTPDLSSGVYEIDVTTAVRAWAAAPGTNFGWAVLPTGSDGVEFTSFDSGAGPRLVLVDEEGYVAAGSMWAFYDGIRAGDRDYPTDDGGSEWHESGFDDSGWPAGTGQLGFGDGDETTLLVPGGITYLFRTAFTVGELPASLTLDLLRDDSARVYLNGVEVIRDNLPRGDIHAGTRARRTGPENHLSSFALDPAALLANQTNVLAVEVHNRSNRSSDISFDLALRAMEDLPAEPEEEEPEPLPEPGAVPQLVAGIALLLGLRGRASR